MRRWSLPLRFARALAKRGELPAHADWAGDAAHVLGDREVAEGLLALARSWPRPNSNRGDRVLASAERAAEWLHEQLRYDAGVQCRNCAKWIHPRRGWPEDAGLRPLHEGRCLFKGFKPGRVQFPQASWRPIELWVTLAGDGCDDGFVPRPPEPVRGIARLPDPPPLHSSTAPLPRRQPRTDARQQDLAL